MIRKRVGRQILLGLVAGWTAGGLSAQGATGGAAEPPSPAAVLGYELGERFTDAAGVVRYMEVLASASPLVEVRRYGESVEGRPLVQVVIARPEHASRLAEILAGNRELADPSTPESRARELAARDPAVVYLTYGVHGNEASSSEAALWTAWDLARGAGSVAGVLDSVVVVMDPVANPDGRDRYVGWYRQVVGRSANANPEAWEHWEPWPGGRYNHYLFDLNRDWAWATQRETRARLATWGEWSPQVHVDFHEMNWESTYFFFPAAPPINPLYPEHTRVWGEYFGAANAAAFDREGWPYYTAESFDLFYPGYGDSWPSLVGAVGMTYEQAGHARAGLVIRRRDGQLLTLRDRAEHHRTAGAATLRAAAARKTALREGFARFHRELPEGAADVLLVPGAARGRVEALVALLRVQGIEVERAAEAFRADARPHRGFGRRREFPAGTYRVRAQQPRGRLALTLLQPEVVLDATYSYDVSAWSLPYAYGVEAHQAGRVPGGVRWEPVVEPVAFAREPSATNGEATEPYGYLVAPEFAAWPGVVRFLEAGGRVRVLDERFRMDGREWPAGTFFLARHGNDRLGERVREAGLGGRAVPVASGLTAEGHDLGTGEAYTLSLPRVALIAGDGTSPMSFGAHWFFLEETLGLPFDAVPAERLRSLQLDRYDVVVVPEVSGGALDERTLKEVEGWVRRGGTLVAVASGARTVAEPVAGVRMRERASREEDEEGEKLARALRGRAERELEDWEEQIPGTILPVRLDPDHPLAFGAGIDGDARMFFTLHRDGIVFEPAESVEVVGHFPAELEKTSGVISETNLARLEQGGWLLHKRLGRGNVILFADDPLFRHFWYSGFQPFTNALLIGPSL